jgi:hypothetical protein
MSQPLPAMATLEAMAAQAGPHGVVPARRNVATIAAIGAVVAVLIMGVVFFALRTPAGDASAPAGKSRGPPNRTKTRRWSR